MAGVCCVSLLMALCPWQVLIVSAHGFVPVASHCSISLPMALCAWQVIAVLSLPIARLLLSLPTGGCRCLRPRRVLALSAHDSSCQTVLLAGDLSLHQWVLVSQTTGPCCAPNLIKSH